MPIDVRAAGALILLFGLQAQRIRHFCAEHVVAQDDNTYLTTGKHPILRPPRLGAIMGELADRPPTQTIPVVTTVALFDTWCHGDFDALRAAVFGDLAAHADTAGQQLSTPAAAEPAATRQPWWRRRGKR
jgi:hypothetical protein